MVEKNESRPLAGVMWMVVTGVLFVGVTALVKYNGTRLPASESAFLRYTIGLIGLTPVLMRLRRAALSRHQWGMFGIRGLLHSFAVALWFFAMARIPIADVTAMGYLAPIYVTLGAALFLGEKLAMRRIIAVLVALLGALIILRPGLREVGPGHMAMLGAAVLFAGSYLIAKQLSDVVDPLLVVALLSLGVAVGLSPLAWSSWIRPTWGELGILSLVALVATLGHYLMTLAFRAAPVTVTQPVTFLQLVWAVALGALVFDEAVDFGVVLGGAVILGAISFMTWREAVIKRRAITPTATATKV